MNILIFSGTTEGREISYRLAEMGHRVTVSVATVFGRAAQESGRTAQKETAGPVQVLQGRLEEADMARVLSGFDLCIDATHPYATAAGENIRKAADEAGVRLLRLQREESPVPEGAIVCESARQAAELLKDTEGNILLTCGVKSLAAFSEIERKRLIVRIIPSEESLKRTIRSCEDKIESLGAVNLRAIDDYDSASSVLISTVEKLVRPHSLTRAMAHRPNPTHECAAANLDRNDWLDPWTGVVRCESFADLYDEALAKYPQMAEALVRDDRPTFDKLGAGLSYEGKPGARE